MNIHSTRPAHPHQRLRHCRAKALGKAFGVMGGYYQAMGHAHLISKGVDYDMDMQDAIDLPRLFPFKGKIQVERGISPTHRGLSAGQGRRPNLSIR